MAGLILSMITKVAKITIIIPTVNQLKTTNDLFTLDELTKQHLYNLLNLISKYNEQNTEKKIEVQNPGIHVLSAFLLKELIKNSIDANATQLDINIYLEGEHPGHVLIQTLDNGDSTESVYDEYCHLSALLKQSEKKYQGKLGGGGKGLAMASQYLALFGNGGLIVGNRVSIQKGFMVTVCAENKPHTLEWNNYFSEFNKFYREINSTYSAYNPNLVDQERQFRNEILEQAANHQRTHHLTFFAASKSIDEQDMDLHLHLEL